MDQVRKYIVRPAGQGWSVSFAGESVGPIHYRESSAKEDAIARAKTDFLLGYQVAVLLEHAEWTECIFGRFSVETNRPLGRVA